MNKTEDPPVRVRRLPFQDNIHSSIFTPRDYQIELLDSARRKNLIMCLGTIPSKMFVALMLLKELAHNIRYSSRVQKKWTVVLFSTGKLLTHYAELIRDHTDLKVLEYFDSVDDTVWKVEIQSADVIVMDMDLFLRKVNSDLLNVSDISLLVLGETHCASDALHPLRAIVKAVRESSCRPKVLGLSANIMKNSYKEPHRLEMYMNALEQTLGCMAETASDIVSLSRFGSRSNELVVQCRDFAPDSLLNVCESSVDVVQSEIRRIVQPALDFVNDHVHKPEEIYGIFDEDLNIPDPCIVPRHYLEELMYLLDTLGPWCTYKASRRFLKELKRHKDNTPYERHYLLISMVFTVMEMVHAICDHHFQNLTEVQKILTFSSPKVLRLLDVIVHFKPANSPSKDNNATITDSVVTVNAVADNKVTVNAVSDNKVAVNTITDNEVTVRAITDNKLSSDTICGGLTQCDIKGDSTDSGKIRVSVEDSLWNREIRSDLNISTTNIDETNFCTANISSPNDSTMNNSDKCIVGKDVTEENLKNDKLRNSANISATNITTTTNNYGTNISSANNFGATRTTTDNMYGHVRTHGTTYGHKQGYNRGYVRGRLPFTINVDDPNALCGLVFVERHNTACIMHLLLKELSRNHDSYRFLSPNFLVGKRKSPYQQQQLENEEITIEHRKQEEVLRRFRLRECNLLVATSVLQDGIDLPKCNLVVSFDQPKDYRAYVQCKGRARATNSHFILLVEGNKTDVFMNHLAKFKAVEEVLLNRCHEREIPVDEEIDVKRVDAILPPYVPSTTSTSKVTLSNAISLVNRYCAKLPSDTFTRLTPRCHLKETKGNSGKNPFLTFRAVLYLPINSPVKQPVIGPSMPNKALAKMAAALKMCEILHKSGELDNNMLPVGKESVQYEEELMEKFEEETVPDGAPKPGTTKRRQYYYKQTAEAFTSCLPQPGEPCHLYMIHMRLTCPIPEEQNTRGRKIYAPEGTTRCFGFITSKPIPKICGFPVFTRSGEVTIWLEEIVPDLLLNESELDRISFFHDFTFSSVLRLQKYPMTYDPFTAESSHFIVPLNKAVGNAVYSIDWTFVEIINEQRDFKPHLIDDCERFGFKFELNKYNDAVVMPWYRNLDQPQYFYVAEICYNLNPRSDFPDDEFETFENYYYKKYNIQIQNLKQPLLDVDHTSARLNLLTPRYVNRKGVALPTSSEETKRAKRENLQQKQILVPELCAIHPFPASFWRKAVCLPCVLYRINCLLVAEKLRVTVANDIELGMIDLPEKFDWPVLDFGWSLADVLKANALNKEIEKEIDEKAENDEKVEKLDGSVGNGNAKTGSAGSGEPKTVKKTGKKATWNGVGKEDPSWESDQPTGGSGFDIGTWSNDMIPQTPAECSDEHEKYEEVDMFDDEVLPGDLMMINDGGIFGEDSELSEIASNGWKPGDNADNNGSPRIRYGSPSNFEDMGWDFDNNEDVGVMNMKGFSFICAPGAAGFNIEDLTRDIEAYEEDGIYQEMQTETFEDDEDKNEYPTIGYWGNNSDDTKSTTTDTNEVVKEEYVEAEVVLEWDEPEYSEQEKMEREDLAKIYFDERIEMKKTVINFVQVNEQVKLSNDSVKGLTKTGSINEDSSKAVKPDEDSSKSISANSPTAVCTKEDPPKEVANNENSSKSSCANEDSWKAVATNEDLLPSLCTKSPNIAEPDFFCVNNWLSEESNDEDLPGSSYTVARPTIPNFAHNEKTEDGQTSFKADSCDNLEDIDGLESLVREEEEDDKKVSTVITSNNDIVPFSFDEQTSLISHPGPSPSVILQALTMSNANDGINLERLETIGDSFLKHAITTYLYCTYPNIHEGKLSYLRSKQVSNLNLYRLGKKKRLGECMVATKFEPNDNWLPPGYYVPKELEQALIDSGIPAGYWNIANLSELGDWKDLDAEMIRKALAKPPDDEDESLEDANGCGKVPAKIEVSAKPPEVTAKIEVLNKIVGFSSYKIGDSAIIVPMNNGDLHDSIVKDEEANDGNIRKDGNKTPGTYANGTPSKICDETNSNISENPRFDKKKVTFDDADFKRQIEITPAKEEITNAQQEIIKTQEGEITNDENNEDLTLFIPYNLMTQHSIPDKSIDDCVEALIGAYLTSCGPRGALLFMSWLGLRVLPTVKSEKVDRGSKDSERESEDSISGSKGSKINFEGPTSGSEGHKKCSEGSASDSEVRRMEYGRLIPPPSPLLHIVPDPLKELDILLHGYDQFEERIGYQFNDRSYLLQAFTHASYHYNRLTDCYQRLEFLGDAVLDYLITRHLYEDPRQHSPGTLTDLRSALVNNTIFATLAVKHDFHKYFKAICPGLFVVIDKFIKMQKENNHQFNEEYYFIEEEECEEAEDIEVPKALGDVFESVAGAIYLDSGMSLDAVWKVYHNMMKSEIEQFMTNVPKSPIRELLEMEPETAKFGIPEKTLDGKVRVTVEIFGKGKFRGLGRNYRIAKCTAAKHALKALKRMNGIPTS